MQAVYAGLGMPLDEPTARHLVEGVRAFVIAAKRPPEDGELLELLHAHTELSSGRPDPATGTTPAKDDAHV